LLTEQEVRRYAHQSGIDDLMIAERDIVLTYALQRLHQIGFMAQIAFKGGTCIRKMIIGSQGRFSMDLDFTALAEGSNPDDMILDLMNVFEKPYHGIAFSITNAQWRVTQSGLSWAVSPTYRHSWNSEGTFELQISNRERPTLSVVAVPPLEQSYFRWLPYTPATIPCLDRHEILAEKIRACYQRQKVRDLYDLHLFATQVYDRPLVRQLVYLKLWQANDGFDPAAFSSRITGGSYNWDDLEQLLPRRHRVDPSTITRTCVEKYGYLGDATAAEFKLARDHHRNERTLHAELTAEAIAQRARYPGS
jgi:predicted nucleotidyltransferase component of viral defense system